MMCGSRTGSHLFPCRWVCTPELAFLIFTTASRSSPLSILAAPYFPPFCHFSSLSSLSPSFLNFLKTSYSSTDITCKKGPPLLWPVSPASITPTPSCNSTLGSAVPKAVFLHFQRYLPSSLFFSSLSLSFLIFRISSITEK